MKKIAIIIAFNGFRDEELFVTYDDLKNDFEVEVFSGQKGEAQGKLGGTFKVTNVIADVVVDNFDALVLIGGPGGYSFLGNKKVYQLIKEFIGMGKLVGAICMAPLILADAGVLKDKKATVFVGEKDNIVSKGAIYTGNEVEQDGNIITANGPASSQGFSIKIREYLNG